MIKYLSSKYLVAFCCFASYDQAHVVFLNLEPLIVERIYPNLCVLLQKPTLYTSYNILWKQLWRLNCLLFSYYVGVKWHGLFFFYLDVPVSICKMNMKCGRNYHLNGERFGIMVWEKPWGNCWTRTFNLMDLEIDLCNCSPELAAISPMQCANSVVKIHAACRMQSLLAALGMWNNIV
jgi:hypothetical protein